MAEYQIVRADSPAHIDGVAALERLVQERAAEGWQAQGGPFFDPAGSKWCQAMSRPTFVGTRPVDAEGNTVRLREPAPVEQQPGSLRVHADPKDGPMIFRQPKG